MATDSLMADNNAGESLNQKRKSFWLIFSVKSSDGPGIVALTTRFECVGSVNLSMSTFKWTAKRSIRMCTLGSHFFPVSNRIETRNTQFLISVGRIAGLCASSARARGTGTAREGAKITVWLDQSRTCCYSKCTPLRCVKQTRRTRGELKTKNV